MNKMEFPFIARLASALLSLILLFYIAFEGQEILTPLVMALLFSLLLMPLANFLERFRLPRSLSALLAVVSLLVIIGFILYFIARQITSLLQDWPSLETQLAQSFSRLQQWISATFHINMTRQLNFLNSTTSSAISDTGSLIRSTFLSLSSTLLFLVFIPIYTFLLLLYRSLLVRFLVALFPGRHSPKVIQVLQQIRSIIKKYILGLFLEMCLVAVLNCTAFWVLGIHYALLLGILSAIFNLVPYVGILTAALLSMLITVASASLSKVLSVGIALWAVHLIDSNVLMPQIVGSKVRINALVTIIGVILGNLIWGITGMFLSIPVIAILKIISDNVEGLQPWGILMGEDPARNRRHPTDLTDFPGYRPDSSPGSSPSMPEPPRE